MLYDDGILTIYELTDADSPDKRQLRELSQHYYGELVVGVTRHYAAMQANESVDMLVELWQAREITTDMYCIPEDKEQYRIKNIQHKTSEQNLKISILTLERLGEHHELEQLIKRPESP